MAAAADIQHFVAAFAAAVRIHFKLRKIAATLARNHEKF